MTRGYSAGRLLARVVPNRNRTTPSAVACRRPRLSARLTADCHPRPIPVFAILACMAEPQPKRRRWYQFSLRTLMLFMVVCAIPSGWVGSKLESTRREQVVVAKLEVIGVTVEYHEMYGPPWITRHFRRIREVTFVLTQGNDTRLAYLKGLTNLESLWIWDLRPTNTGLEHLKELTCLKQLVLFCTETTDEDVAKLQQALPNCEIIHNSSLPFRNLFWRLHPTPSRP